MPLPTWLTGAVTAVTEVDMILPVRRDPAGWRTVGCRPTRYKGAGAQSSERISAISPIPSSWRICITMAVIASSAFAGKTRVAQHQLVYAALKGRMGGVLHALQLETRAK